MTTVVLLMAGLGSRMQMNKNKMLLKINGKYLFEYTIELFEKFTHEILLVVSKDDYDFFKELSLDYKIVIGGSTRQESVLNALYEVKTERVLIHDGARILTSNKIIEKCLDNDFDAYFVGIPLKNTIRYSADNNYQTLDRSKLIDVQTPQGGKTAVFLKCAKKAYENNRVVTDDISMLEDVEINYILGDEKNIKVTTPNDLLLAKNYLMEGNMRIGHAWDTHRLVSGRELILGGVKVQSDLGLLGHSDADVVLHAVAESFLGALALGDLGSIYPDTSDETLGMDSKIILSECYQKVLDKGYTLGNLDLTIYSEQIKISPIRQQIRQSIADILAVDVNKISVKATTYEKMGFIGRNEGIACECVCIIV